MELRDLFLRWKEAACVHMYACYLDVREMRVVAVGSAGAHCLCETLGRRGQGWFPLTECSEEYLVAAELKINHTFLYSRSPSHCAVILACYSLNYS